MDVADIGQYRPGDRLGGSRAVVRVGTDRRTGREVVLKTAPWERPEVTAALAREAAILDRVSHPSLVTLLDVVEHVEGRTLVLQNASGGDLTRLLATRGALDATAAADVGARLAGALGALHDGRVVHRDVRPSNVVLDAELVPMLCDLDHALDPSQPPLASDTRIVGDAAHVDPRLFDGHPQGASMDLFGLGSVVWAAVTGGLPRPTDLRDAVGSVPTPLLMTIAACLDGTIGDARAAAAAYTATASEVRPWRPSVAAPPAASGQVGARTGVAEAGVDPIDHPTPRPSGGMPPPTSKPAAGDVRRTAWSGPDGAVARSPSPRHRVTALSGGGAGAASPTRRWAPPGARRPELDRHGTVTRRPRRAGVAVGAVVAAAAVVTSIGWALHAGRGDSGAAVAAGEAAATEQRTRHRSDEPDGGAAVAPPSPCDGEEPATVADASGTQVAWADVRGAGCGVALSLSGDVLTTPEGRYRVGRTGDRLLAGDWDGDGRWSPGIHRPDTGQVFLFTNETDPAGQLVSGPALRFPPNAELVVVAGGAGPHHLTVAPSER